MPATRWPHAGGRLLVSAGNLGAVVRLQVAELVVEADHGERRVAAWRQADGRAAEWGRSGPCHVHARGARHETGPAALRVVRVLVRPTLCGTFATRLKSAQGSLPTVYQRLPATFTRGW